MESVCEPGGTSPSSDGSDSEGQETSDGIDAGSEALAAPRRTPSGAGSTPSRRAACRRRRPPGRCPDLSRGQPVEQEVDLELGALGLGLRVVGLAQQDVQHPRARRSRARTLASTVAGPPAVSKSTSFSVVAGPDRGDAGADPDLRARPRRPPGPARRSARPCRRPAPAARRCRCRSAGRGSSGSAPATGRAACRSVPTSASVATTPRTVSSANRFSITSPSGVVTKSRQVAGSTCAARSFSQGSGSRRVGSTARAIAADLGVEAAPRVVLAAAVGELEERGAGAPALRVLDQQPAVPAVAEERCVGRDRARREPPRRARARSSAGSASARPARRSARPASGRPANGWRGDRGAADAVEPLEHQHGEPGPGEVGRRDEAVVASADDRDVVPPEGGVRGRHSSNLAAVGRRWRRRRPRGICNVQLPLRPAPTNRGDGSHARDHRRRPHRPAAPARARARRPAPPGLAGDDGADRATRARGSRSAAPSPASTSSTSTRSS